VRDDGKGTGTDETLVAPSAETVDASIAPRSAEPAGPDYGDLVQVDPAHYSLGAELARGGMGRIVKARDRRLGRRVAIKQLLHDDPDALLRFEREVRITARLEHPSIVAVHEAGRWPSGEPFYAMKLIAGRPLDRCIGAAATLRDRLALLGNVTAAVNALAYAHSERVIHRDLKPANVLVGDYGETVVIDWGLAKDLSARDGGDLPSLPPRDTSSGGETIAGAVIGTPSYMPPEQAAGEPVDERADVYSLGALLYHVLAGVPPYVARTASEVLALVLAGPPKPIADREPDAPADLIAIAEKAMAREPAQRFATATEMARELERFGMGQLVTSRSYTTWELVWRWVRRYRAAVTVGVIALAALLVFGTLGLVEIFAERDRADRRAAEARTRGDDGAIVRARELVDTDPAAAVAQLRELSAGSPNWRAAHMIAADALERGVADVLRGDGVVHRMAMSRDRRYLATYDETTVGNTVTRRRVRIWDLATWTARACPAGERMLADLAFTADGQLVLADYHGRVRRLDPAGGCELAVVRERPGDYHDVRLQPGGRQIALLYYGEPSILLDLASGTERALGEYSLGAWAPDGASLAMHERHEGMVVRFDVRTGDIAPLGGPTDAITIVTNGRGAWVGNAFGVFAVTPNMVGPDRAKDPLDEITSMGVLPDGRIATIYAHGRLSNPSDTRDLEAGGTAVTVRDGPTRLELLGHEADLDELIVSPDGRIVTSDRGGSVRIWRLPRVDREHGTGTQTLATAAMTRDRGRLVITKRGPTLEVHDLHGGPVRRIAVTERPPSIPEIESGMVTSEIGDRRFIERVNGPVAHVVELARSGEGLRLASLDDEKHVEIWDLDAGHGRLLPIENAEHVAMSADGRLVVTVRWQNDNRHPDRRIVESWSVSGGAPAFVLEDSQAISALAVAPDGSRIAVTTTRGGSVYLVHGDDADELETGENNVLHVLAFSDDGKLLVGGGDHWEIDVWNLVTHGSRQLVGHSGTIAALVFSPDGTRLASTAGDNTVRVWRLADGAEQVLRGHTDRVRTIEWSADGEYLLTGSDDRTARLWDLVTKISRPLAGHVDKVVFAGFSADGRRLIVVDHAAEIATHYDDLPRNELGLRAWLAQVAHDVRAR
jgi:eukaryotic-like serine/threonine-protein kinase